MSRFLVASLVIICSWLLQYQPLLPRNNIPESCTKVKHSITEDTFEPLNNPADLSNTIFVGELTATNRVLHGFELPSASHFLLYEPSHWWFQYTKTSLNIIYGIDTTDEVRRTYSRSTKPLDLSHSSSNVSDLVADRGTPPINATSIVVISPSDVEISLWDKERVLLPLELYSRLDHAVSVLNVTVSDPDSEIHFNTEHLLPNAQTNLGFIECHIWDSILNSLRARCAVSRYDDHIRSEEITSMQRRIDAYLHLVKQRNHYRRINVDFSCQLHDRSNYSLRHSYEIKISPPYGVFPQHSIDFGSCSIRETTERYFTVRNPRDDPIQVQLLPLSSLLGNSGFSVEKMQGMLQNMNCHENLSHSFLRGQESPRKLEVSEESSVFRCSPKTQLPRVILPHQTGRLGPISFDPSNDRNYSSVFLLRNNVTEIDIISVQGTGGRGKISLIQEEKSWMLENPITLNVQCCKTTFPTIEQSINGTNYHTELPVRFSVGSTVAPPYPCQSALLPVSSNMGFSWSVVSGVLPLELRNTGQYPMRIWRLEFDEECLALDNFEVLPAIRKGEIHYAPIDFQSTSNIQRVYNDTAALLDVGQSFHFRIFVRRACNQNCTLYVFSDEEVAEYPIRFKAQFEVCEDSHFDWSRFCVNTLCGGLLWCSLSFLLSSQWMSPPSFSKAVVTTPIFTTPISDIRVIHVCWSQIISLIETVSSIFRRFLKKVISHVKRRSSSKIDTDDLHDDEDKLLKTTSGHDKEHLPTRGLELNRDFSRSKAHSPLAFRRYSTHVSPLVISNGPSKINPSKNHATTPLLPNGKLKGTIDICIEESQARYEIYAEEISSKEVLRGHKRELTKKRFESFSESMQSFSELSDTATSAVGKETRAMQEDKSNPDQAVDHSDSLQSPCISERETSAPYLPNRLPRRNSKAQLSLALSRDNFTHKPQEPHMGRKMRRSGSRNLNPSESTEKFHFKDTPITATMEPVSQPPRDFSSMLTDLEFRGNMNPSDPFDLFATASPPSKGGMGSLKTHYGTGDKPPSELTPYAGAACSPYQPTPGPMKPLPPSEPKSPPSRTPFKYDFPGAFGFLDP